MKLQFILLIIVATVSIGAKGKDDSNSPVPIDASSWFSFEDYPASSLKANEHGAVAFRLLVNDEGGVISCKITKSSGFPALDNQTCSSALQRAHFDKSEAKGNKPRQYDSKVTWVIPVGQNGEEPLQSMRMAFTAKLDGQGLLVGCGLTVDSKENATVVEVCRSMRDTAARLGIAQRSDAPDGMTLISDTTKSFPGKPVPGDAADDLTEIGHRTIRFHIDKAGRAVDCKEERSGELFSFTQSPCDAHTKYMTLDRSPVETDGVVTERSGWRRVAMAGGV